MARGFASDTLGNIAYSKIDRIRCLIPKDCELCLVGLDDHWHNGSPFMFIFQ